MSADPECTIADEFIFKSSGTGGHSSYKLTNTIRNNQNGYFPLHTWNDSVMSHTNIHVMCSRDQPKNQILPASYAYGGTMQHVRGERQEHCFPKRG